MACRATGFAPAVCGPARKVAKNPEDPPISSGRPWHMEANLEGRVALGNTRILSAVFVI